MAEGTNSTVKIVTTQFICRLGRNYQLFNYKTNVTNLRLSIVRYWLTDKPHIPRMSFLRPYPHSFIDQNFGLCINPEDLLFPIYYNGDNNYCRPWRWVQQTGHRDTGSSIYEENNIFKINLDVQQFKAEEIKVKVNDNEIIVEANHEERLDEHGFISRHFKRRYILPFEYSSDTVDCTLSSDGILILTAKKMTKTVQTREILVPVQINEASKEITTNQRNESKTINLQSSNEDTSVKAVSVSNQRMTKENNSTKINECDVKALEPATEENLQISSKRDNQFILEEDHCRLLKPELLGATMSVCKKIEELKQIIEQVSATSKTSELAASSKACSEATSTKIADTRRIDKSKDALLDNKYVSESKKIEELKQITEQVTATSKTSDLAASSNACSESKSIKVADTQLMDNSKAALSDNKYAGLGIISTISDHCQTTSDMKDINRISEVSSALEEASATSLSTKENILQSVENMNVTGTTSSTQEIMESLEISSLKSSASAMSSQEVVEVSESNIKECTKISESLGKSSARSLGVSSTIEDMMDKCSAEIAEITCKYPDPGFKNASGTAKMHSSMSYSSSEIQESFSSSTTKASSGSSSILMSDVMAELRDTAEVIRK